MAAACSDPVAPEPALVQQELTLSGVIETTDGRIVYSSLHAGTVPGGILATVTNLETGAAVEAPMVEGGLDPVALPASEGDSIEVRTRDGAGGIRYFGAKVELRYPPVVVRTGPTRGAVDVGLNSIVLVVFSEPIEERTLSPETIELSLDGQRVPAEVTPTADGLRARLDPGGLLPLREYTLVVRREVRDRDGQNLREEYRSTFSTVSVATVASVAVSADSLSVKVGQPLAVRASLLDSLGNPIPGGFGRRVTWSAGGDAHVVDMGDNTAAVRARTPGRTTVTATFEGRESTLDFNAATLRFVSVSAGHGYTCALTEAGYAYCWGLNTSGEIAAIENPSKASIPTAVFNARLDASLAGDRFASISAGDRYTCALHLNHLVRCWGAKGAQWYAGPWHPDWLPFADVSTGLHQACGLEADGRVICWGRFPEPDGTSVSWFYGALPFVEGRRIQAIASGSEHSCGLEAEGTVVCWGVNDHGQLGDGTFKQTWVFNRREGVSSPQPTQVVAPVVFRMVSAGSRHTCALDASGRAYCWGEVNGKKVPSPQPVVGGDVTFSTLSGGDGFTCGLTQAGQAYCWGRNAHGQLGIGTTEDAVAPTPVSGGQSFSAISAGRDHACGIMADGLLYCWGRGIDGELGNDLMTDQPTPVPVVYQR